MAKNQHFKFSQSPNPPFITIWIFKHSLSQQSEFVRKTLLHIYALVYSFHWSSTFIYLSCNPKETLYSQQAKYRDIKICRAYISTISYPYISILGIYFILPATILLCSGMYVLANSIYPCIFILGIYFILPL